MTADYLIQHAAQAVVDTLDSLGSAATRPILLVGGDREIRSAVLEAAAAKLGVMVINVGIALPTAVLNGDPTTASHRATEIFEGTFPPQMAPVLLDHIEVLFAPFLRTNALELLIHAARTRPICVNWPGTVEHRRIRYAKYGHPECLDEDAKRVLVIDTTQTER